MWMDRVSQILRGKCSNSKKDHNAPLCWRSQLQRLGITSWKYCRQMIDTDTDNKINYSLQSLCYRVSQLSCSYTLCTRAEKYETANTIISMSVCTNLSSGEKSFSAALIKASKHTFDLTRNPHRSILADYRNTLQIKDGIKYSLQSKLLYVIHLVDKADVEIYVCRENTSALLYQ